MSATPLASLRQQHTRQPQSNGALARQERRGIIDLLNEPKVKQGLAIVAGKLLSPDRVMKLVTNAIYRTPKLAQCEPKTVLGALMASVSLGLEPNTPQGHAYLIPYKRRAQVSGQWVDVYECQFQVGYKGLIVLGYRSPRIRTIDAEAIHQNDRFRALKGSTSLLEYEMALTDRGPLVGAFCHSLMADAGEVATILPLEKIEALRAKSETYTALARRLEEAKTALEAAPNNPRAQKDYSKARATFDATPWVANFDEMASKSAIKRHVNAKLPLDPGDFLRAAIELDNAGDRGVIDLSALADPDATMALVHDGELPHEAVHEDAAEPGDDDQNLEGAQEGEPPTPHDSGADGAPLAESPTSHSPPQEKGAAPESPSTSRQRARVME